MKAPNGEPSILFPQLVRRLGVDDAYRAYLLSEAPSVRQKHGLKPTENGEIAIADLMSILDTIEMSYNFKSTQEPDNKAKPDTESVAQKIIEESKLVGKPEEDAEGNQGNFYTILDSAGNAVKKVSRISSVIGNFLYGRAQVSKNENVSPIDQIVENKVSWMFKGVPAGEKISHRGGMYNREELAENLRNSYKQGQIKGNIIHALLEKKLTSHLPGSPEYKDIENRIAKYKAMTLRTNPDEYDWVLNDEVFNAIVNNLGLKISTARNKLPASEADKIYTEVTIANELIDAGGQIDTLVENSSGYLRVTDTKTGNNFDRKGLGSRIMKYGNQTNGPITDTSIDRAKLQTVLYSMLIKLNHPEAKLLPPKILHLPNEYKALSPDTVHEVDVADYLRMIENYYRAEEPAKYKALLEKSPDIFNPLSYGHATNSTIENEFLASENPSKLLERKELELQALQNSFHLKQDGDKDWDPEDRKRRDKLMKEILQARSMGIQLPNHMNAEHGVKLMTKWVGTLNDSHNPFLQAYAQRIEQARTEARNEFRDIQMEYDSLLSKVMADLGQDPTGWKGKNVRIKDPKTVFGKMLKTIENETDEGVLTYDRRMVIPSDPEWNNLTENEKNLLKFMQDKMKSTFEEVMVSGPAATIAYQNGRPLSKLDIYRREHSFSWTEGFIPRVSITNQEVNFKVFSDPSAKNIKGFAKDWVKRHVSLYYEEHVDGDYNEKQYGLPVRYLGSGQFQHNPEIHSENLEHVFKSFMQHYTNKKHYDTVYSLGDSIKQYIDVKSKNIPVLDDTVKFLENHMKRHLLGRFSSRDSDYTRRGAIMFKSEDGREVSFSVLKLMRTLGGYAAMAGLALRPISAAKNAGQALWAVSKHGWVNAIAHSKFSGLKMEEKDGSARFIKNSQEWLDWQKSALQGKNESHPIKVLMDTFQLYPDTNEFASVSGYLTGTGKLLHKNMATSLHGYPEEWTTAALAVTTLDSMIIQEGKYAGQSMWQVYKNSVEVDPTTGKGYFKLPEDFTRGKIKDGSGVVRDWKGLEPIEVQKLKRVIQTVKGGYRIEERTMLESTALGEMMMIFKRWLPSTLIQAGHSKKSDPSLGFFEKKPGEDHYEWKSRVTEGRFRTIGGVFSHYVLRSRFNGYDFGSMTDWQKKNLIDAGFTFGAILLALISYGALMSDRDEKDSIRTFYWSASMRLIEQWDPHEMLKSATSEAVLVRTVSELAKGMAEMGMAAGNYAIGSDEDEIYNRRGEFKGLGKVLKNNPMTSWWYSGEKFIDEIGE